MSTEQEDRDLMLAYARGDAPAFDKLYAIHSQALYRFVKNSCASEALAHELYQDIWMRVINARTSYSPKAPFRAWLYRIARNRLTDHYRQQSRIDTHETAEDPDAMASQVSPLVTTPLSPELVASLSQQNEILDKALLQLPAAQREAVLLRHIVGMSVKEVAEMMDQGVETVKSRLRYGTAKLRSLLQELS